MKPRKRQEPPVIHPRLMTPTPEQMAKGGYEAPETRGALAVYTNRRSNYFAKLLAHGVVTKRQYAAGLAFEGTHQRAWGGISPSKDSTIFGIGGECHETEAQAERVSRAKARLHTILHREPIGPMGYSLLRQVCVWGESLGSAKGAGKAKVLALRKLLCEALDECAIVYGIDREAA